MARAFCRGEKMVLNTVPMNSIPARCSSCRLAFSSEVHSLTCEGWGWGLGAAWACWEAETRWQGHGGVSP